MATATTLTAAPRLESQKGAPATADMLDSFAIEASAERVNPGRGLLWGLFLSGGLWVGIFALVFYFKG